MLLEHERNKGFGMDALVSAIIKNERISGLGMDALVIACSWNMNGIMVWTCLDMDALVSAIINR